MTTELRVDLLRPINGAQGDKEGPVAEEQTWWGRYQQSLDRLSAEARLALGEDSRWVIDRAVPLDGTALARDEWGFETRLRTGIVVGSVQSGKTSHMLGVAAMGLDRGVDILIVLAGTRLALWTQTYERLLTQLDRSNAEDSWARDEVRALVPPPYDLLHGERADPRRYTTGSRYAVESALSARRPVLMIIPKEDDHLRTASRFLRDVLPISELQTWDRPVCMLVLDDEADDASILDARDGSKVTPQFIASLWSGHVGSASTRHPNLLASYVAYTATPQANYLQHTHNPLTPRHFHAVLRVPLDNGSIVPRSLSYQEPGGLKRYYCGGDLFYDWLQGQPGDPCIAHRFPDMEPDEDGGELDRRVSRARRVILADALRAYLVAGALRLLHQRKRLRNISPGEPTNLGRLEELLPSPHTMLYHPSALRDEHFHGAAEIALWSSLTSDEEFLAAAGPAAPAAPATLDPAALTRRLDVERGKWQRWVGEYQASVSVLSLWPGSSYENPASYAWDEVRDTLVNDVFPFTRLRVLNSDARADERPNFQPIPTGDERRLHFPPPDIYSIFVAGNVLSRGLTVEGLCTSVFVRSAGEPAADTQMQMQRWFGYRGAYLPYCRLFTFADQLSLFRAYHQNDIALKQRVLAHMTRSGTSSEDGVLVLAGEGFSATAKVDSFKAPLHPGPTPAIRLIEPELTTALDESLDMVGRQLCAGDWVQIDVPAGHLRGFIRQQTISLIETAELLESLRYSVHDPDPAHPLYQRWAHLAEQLGVPGPLLRAPGCDVRSPAVDPSSCPYSIAAYLRLWDACLQRTEAAGLYPTDAPGTPWSAIDHVAYRASRPVFHVALRSGSLGPVADSRLVVNGVRVNAMVRGLSPYHDYLLETLWGTRGREGMYFGDQLIDYHLHQSQPVPRLHGGNSWRPRGHPGLILFHIVRLENGVETLAVGLALPHGGPDHIAALSGWSPRV